MKSNIVKVAVIQDSPEFFNKSKTLEKSIELINSAYKMGARLIVFPEAFIPAYPRGFNFGINIGNRKATGRDLWQTYFENSVEIPSPETELLAKEAKKHNLYISMGIVEKEGASLFCTNLLFGPEGKLLGKHQKIKPTAGERYIWGEGDGTTLSTYDTDIGIIGGLICWENYMPLARMAMYRKGVQLYIAPTADQRDDWQHTIRHIALEGRCFVLSCNQFVKKDMIPEEFLKKDGLTRDENLECRGGSLIVSPMGKILAGPLWDQAGILYANLDLNEVVRAKFDFDVAGHYNRPDVFKFDVPDQPPSLKAKNKKSLHSKKNRL